MKRLKTTREPRAAKLALFACVIGMLSSMVSLFLGTFPLFLQPVSTAMHWSRAAFPTVLMIIGLSGALLGPVIGRLIDRFGARPTALVGTACWGLGLAAFSAIQASAFDLVAATTLLAIGGGLAGQLVFARIISRWFTVNRGLALGIALGAAPALGQAGAAPLVAAIIAKHGWQAAYLALGMFVLSVTLGANALFLREPDDTDVTVGETEDAAVGEGIGPAVRSRRFWLLTLATGLAACAYNAIFQHSVAILGAKAVPAAVATAFVSVVGLSAMISPLLVGAILDRARHPRLVVFPFVACALVGALLTGFTHGDVAILAGAIFFGISVGAGPVSQPFILSRYFGLKSQSEILGLSLIVVIAGSVGGPVLMGICFDRFGDYRTGVVLFQIVAAVAAALALMLPAYRYGETIVRS